MTTQIPRLVPERPFPPYTFVPDGPHPHPTSDPRGHSHGREARPQQPLTTENWPRSELYRYGIDLFNHGYYWEAHESWETLWHACGRAGRVADFLKGLIKLAAAGVKVREGRPAGVQSHARRATDLFQGICEDRANTAQPFLGLDVAELGRFARRLAEQRTCVGSPPIVFDLVLRPVGLEG